MLPEYTDQGRQTYHGDDELIAVAEKSVLRVADLIEWLVPPNTVQWDRGTKSVCSNECVVPSELNWKQSDPPPDQKLGPGPGLDMLEVEKVRRELGDQPDPNEAGVLVVSCPQYCRFRSILKRLDGATAKWLRNSLIQALGGFATKTRNTFVLFAKETFDYPELEEHPFLCNHLAPKLKGRPRKRRRLKDGAPNSPEDGSNGFDNSPLKSALPSPVRTGSRKDLLAILSQKNTKEESEFLQKLIKFMEERNTPIERPPMLGFKQIDLHLFFQKVCELGGYDGCVSKKAWKSVYDELGGNPQNTSAATCTRRHYEKFLLSYEKYIKPTYGDAKVLKSEEGKEEENLVKKEINGNATNGLRELMGCPDKTIENQNANEPKREIEPKDLKVPKLEEPKVIPEMKPKIGIKPLNLLKHPDLMSKEEKTSEQNREKLKREELMLSQCLRNDSGMEEGGSALQNLAKIASRYSSTEKNKNREQDFSTNLSKKPRLESSHGDHTPSIAQPLPPSSNKKPPVTSIPMSFPSSLTNNDAALGKWTNNAATSLLQQFSLLSASLFPGWPGAQSSSSIASGGAPTTPTISSNPTLNSAAGWPPSSTYNLDPSKIGQEGYNLLKYYEQQLKALQQGSLNQSKMSSSSKDTSYSKKETASTPKAKEKGKVSHPPPDTKRPPRLLSTPCQFMQTASIYGSPRSELQKVKETSSNKTQNSRKELLSHSGEKSSDFGVLDLSSCSTEKKNLQESLPSFPIQRTPSVKPLLNSEQPSEILNLSKPPPNKAGSDHILSISPDKVSNQNKSSPFSTESLLKKYSTTNKVDAFKVSETENNKGFPLPNSDLSHLMSTLQRSSPNMPKVSPAATPHTNTHSPSIEKRSKTPSNTPASNWSVNNNISSSRLTSPVSQMSRQSSQEERRTTPISSQGSWFSSNSNMSHSSSRSLASMPSISSGMSATTFSSLSSLPVSSLQQPNSSYMNALLKQSSASALQPDNKLSSLLSMPPGYPAVGNPMDPTSQYYAALYQQQIAAYQQAAAAAALSNPFGAQQAAAAAAAQAGYLGAPSRLQSNASAEMQALQSYKDMMTRAALVGNPMAQGSVPQSSQPPVTSHMQSQAANSYAALYAGLMGYPQTGFPHPPRKDP